MNMQSGVPPPFFGETLQIFELNYFFVLFFKINVLGILLLPPAACCLPPPPQPQVLAQLGGRPIQI